MANAETKSAATLGFLTVLEHAQHGLMGGYLVLNPSGRPLEFHCTAPIKPNRAQQILFGPTLEPYIYGEQIAQALVNKSTHEPQLLCTDLRPVLAVRGLVPMPVALVLPPESLVAAEAAAKNELPASEAASESLSAGSPQFRVDPPHAGANFCHFQVGRNRLAVAAEREADRNLILERLARLGELFDLAEPFARIREAIEEAQRGSR
jgi:hypothetical protein